MSDYYSADEYDFATELVGKSIRNIDKDRISLSDGTTLTIEQGGDCCAWFEGVVREVDLDQNVITRVERAERDIEDDDEEDCDEHWTINIYTAHKLIAAVDIDGNPGNGYYGSSINLRVRSTHV